MNDPSTLHLTSLLDGVRRGDLACQQALFAKLYDRLVLLIDKVLYSFPQARQRHDTNSLAHDLYLALVDAFASGHIPEDGKAMIAFAAHRLRWLLLDEARKMKRRRTEQVAVPEEGHEQGASSWNPELLARWTEFHQQVDALPDEQRQVVEMHLYLGLTQAEVSEQLGLSPKAVSRLWLAASVRLASFIPE